MIDLCTIKQLMSCFPGSFINDRCTFIAVKKASAHTYICLSASENEMELKCRVLEWLSRSACKTLVYDSDRHNRKLWTFMREGINKYLGTSFSHDDMMEIYTYLGNCINRPKTIRFIESGYDLAVLAGDPHDNPGQ